MSVKALLQPLAGSCEVSVPKVGVGPLASLVQILKSTGKFINCQNTARSFIFNVFFLVMSLHKTISPLVCSLNVLSGEC